MQQLLFLMMLFLAFPPTLIAKMQLPVVRSEKRIISIRDGNQFFKDIWTLDPVKTDVYHVNRPQKNGKVTYITDIDSISFDIEYGKEIDFIVLLNGKDSCLNRVSATYDGVISFDRIVSANIVKTDTIPFRMRKSRIYFKGRVNGHDDISFQFDLGAGAAFVNIKSIAKVGAAFEGKIMVHNSNGINEESLSTHNTLEIGPLRWHEVPLIRVRNMNSDEDVIIGNTLFGDKVISIDYEKKIIIVSDRLPLKSAGYHEYETIFIQNRPCIKTVLSIAGKDYSDWFLFDTGRDGTMVIRDEFVAKYDLWDKFKTIFNLGNKKIVVIPEVSLGGITFKNIVTNAANPAAQTGRQSLLGNELLNHFNMILDNPNGMIYLKPNQMPGRKYSNYNDFIMKAVFSFLTGFIVISGLLILTSKWLKKRKILKIRVIN